MNAFKRSLAMLMVIAMMIPSFAFAQADEVLVMSQEPIAMMMEEANEVTDETETADEAAIALADLFAEFPAEEELTIVEESEEEESNEEAAEQESEEIRMDELVSSLSACTHPNGEFRYGREVFVSATDNGDGTHTRYFFAEDHLYCPDCDVEYTETAEETSWMEEEHDWYCYMYDGKIESYCNYCEAANSCDHEFAREEYYRYIQSVNDNGDGTHTISYYPEYADICAKCEAILYLGYSEETLITVTEEHRVEYGWCMDCGAEVICEHASIVQEYEDKSNFQVISSNEKTCSYTYDLVAWGECPDCGQWVDCVLETGLKAENKLHEWGSYWDENDNLTIKCYICGAANKCNHEWYVGYEYRDIRRAQDNGDGTHDVTYYGEYSYECDLCGANYWKAEEELTTAENEPHEFEGPECRWCRAKNPCTHPNAELVNEDEYGKVTVHACDAAGHTITAYYSYRYHCPDCYSNFEIEDEIPHIVNQTLPHEFHEGYCWICEYSNPCKHPDFEFMFEGYDPDWEKGEYVISTTATTHTYWAKAFRGGECPDCGEYIYENGTESVQRTEAHYYYDGDTACSLCDYVPTCKHTNTAVSKYIHSYYASGDVVKLNDKLHSVVHKVVKEEVCIDCGFTKETVQSSYTTLEPHSYYLSSRCECGHVNTCAHKNTITDSWYNWSSETYLDEHNHKLNLSEIEAVICADCGATLSEKKDGSTSETEPHYYGAANICTCGYISTCKHSSTTSSSDTYTYFEAISLENHQKVTIDVKSIYCKSCKACLSHRSTRSVTFGKAAAHTFEGGVCTGCGLPEQGGACRHAWENGTCTKCGEACAHNYSNCVCLICGMENHVIVDCICTGCGKANHTVENCACTACGKEIHTIENCACTACGKEAHTYENCICTACGKEQHTIEQCVCTVCGKEAHDFVDRVCTVCGAEDMTPEAIIVNGLDENNTLTIGAGLTHLIDLNIQPAGAEMEVVYSTSNKKNVSVNAEGLITGAAAGKSAKITVAPADAASTVAPVTFTVKVAAAPKSVALSASKATLGVENALQLTASVSPANAIADLTVTSSNTAVAAVNDVNGVYTITAVSAGTSTITVKTQNGKKATCVVTVVEKPTAIALDLANAELAAGEAIQLTAAAEPAKTAPAITWTSSNEAVAVVENGKVTAIAAGEAVITATTYNGLAASCSVKVWNAPATIVIEESAKLSVGQKFTPTIKLLDENGEETIGAFTLKTSNKKAAPISGGVVSAKKADKKAISITAEAFNGVKAVCKLSVVAAPSKVAITPANAALGVNEKIALKVSHTKADAPTTYAFSTSDASIANVVKNEDGAYILEAYGQVGTATITVKTHNGKKATCKVTVKAEPEGVVLDKEFIEVAAGEQAQLAASLTNDSASAITWTSSDETIATVENGIVTTIAAGEAVITAATYNGKTASCSLKVWNAPAAIVIEESAKLSVGQKFTPTVKLLDENGNETIGAYTLKTGNKKCAPISNGVVTAKKAAKNVNITAEAYNGVQGVCKVTVVAAPKKVSISPAKATLGVGETTVLTVKHTAADAPTTYSFSSNKPGIAKVVVNEEGAYILETYAAGAANITVKTHNGKKATCKVTVKAAPESIALNAEHVDVVYQKTAQLKAILPEKTASAITWTSSDENIVSVEKGLITAKTQGEAVITATTFNGHSASCTVKVWWPAQSVYIANYNVTLSVGQKLTPEIELWDGHFNETIGAYSLKTSNKKLVPVSGTSISAKKATPAGKPVRIDVILDGEALDCFWVTVVAAPGKVTLPETAAEMQAGETFQLQPDTNGAPTTFTYTSDNAAVAAVDANGLVTAAAPGTAKITVKTHNGKTAAFTVTVKEEQPVPSVDLASIASAQLAPVSISLAD